MAIFPHPQARMLMAAGRQVIERNRVQTEEGVPDPALAIASSSPPKGPLQDSDGRVIGIFGISRDITDAKRAEADLRERRGCSAPWWSNPSPGSTSSSRASLLHQSPVCPAVWL